MDSFSFASLAQIKILLVPVGPIRKSAFEKRAAEIRSFDNISLADIAKDDNGERARFMPTQGPLATGCLHLSFPSHPAPAAQQPLSLFRPSLFPLGVIGIASCSSDPLSNTLHQFNEILGSVIPHGAMFPLVRQCFAFEHEGGDGSTLADQISGVEVIPSMDAKSTKMHIGTLLAGLCTRILGDLSIIVKNLESPVGNEYLNSGLFSTIPLFSEFPLSLDQNQRPNFIQSQNSQPDLTTLRKSSLPTPQKRNSSAGAVLSLRQATLSAPPTTKKRNSGIGVSSSHGRLFKLLGDLFLLSGRNEDATVWYTEAIVIFKSSPDPVWHASALEGLATISVLDSWSSGHELNSPSILLKEPWTEISDKLSQSSAMYFKSSPASDAEHHYAFLVYLYVTAVLRHTALYFAVWSAKGWGPLAFTTMLNPGLKPYLPPTLAHPDQLTYIHLERLSSVTGIRRSQISGILTSCHGPWLLHLSPRDRVNVLEIIAGYYGCLGYKRKEAYILREVLGCIMDLVVCGREQHNVSHIESGRQSGHGPLGLSIPATPSDAMGMVGIRENEIADGNESVMKLVKHVCQVHGINLEAVEVVNRDALKSSKDGGGSECDTDLLISDDEPFLMEVGWPELQIGIVREAIAIAEALPDYPSVAQCCLSALKTLHPVMPSADQEQLYSAAARALITARRRGDPRCVEYWSGKPVATIEMTSSPLTRLPIEKDISVLQVRRSEVDAGLAGVTDPFLYNPRRSTAGKGRLLIVQDEDLQFRITLRNPYVFDLELSSLSLTTSGVPFESKPISVTVPSNSFHAVFIIGRALKTGILTIRGCRVQAPDGLAHEFILPLSTEEEEERQARRKSAMECDFGRFKHSGSAVHWWMKTDKKRASVPISLSGRSSKSDSIRFMEFKVVPEMPFMRIRRTSLTHGALMLYNGEKSMIWLTLENMSSLPIDYLDMSFEDSTKSPAQQALGEGELSVFDTYETEYDLIHRAVFSWEGQNHKTRIPPGKTITVNISCFGKTGCTNGAIHISYAHTKSVLEADSAEVFYTRQLSCPILVTVYHALECFNMDIVSYPDLAGKIGLVEDENIDSIHEADDEGRWCLFSIEVKNTYALPFEVTFEWGEGGSIATSTTCLIAPGSTLRVVLPMRKMLLSEDQVSKPIPTLSDRQFVVEKSNLSSREEKARRELFWYREELLKRVKGRWKEAGGTRSGDLSLRQQRLTFPMLRAFRTESIRVQMDLLRYESDDEDGEAQPPKVMNRRKGKVFAQPNEFVYLRTRVTNLSASSLILTGNLFFEPSKHIIFQGVLLDIPIGRLESGEKREIEIPLCFMSCGRFDMRSAIHVYGASREEKVAGAGRLTAIIKDN